MNESGLQQKEQAVAVVAAVKRQPESVAGITRPLINAKSSWRGLLVATLWLAAMILANSKALQAETAGMVNTPTLKVYQEADGASSVLEILYQGDHFEALTAAEKGFFKIRTFSKKIGYIAQEKILLDPTAEPLPAASPQLGEAASSNATPAASASLAALDASMAKKGQPSAPGSSSGYENWTNSAAPQASGLPEVAELPLKTGRFQVSLASGMQVVNMNGLISILNIKNSTYFALTGSFKPGGNLPNPGLLAAALRVELFRQAVSFADANTTFVYNMSLAATPISVGIRVGRSGRKFSFHGGLFATAVFKGSGSVMSVNDGTTGQVSGDVYGGLAQVEGSYRVNSFLSVFAEGGYRILRSRVLDSNSNSSLLDYTAFLDWGGPFIGGGLTAEF